VRSPGEGGGFWGGSYKNRNYKNKTGQIVSKKEGGGKSEKTSVAQRRKTSKKMKKKKGQTGKRAREAEKSFKREKGGVRGWEKKSFTSQWRREKS